MVVAVAIKPSETRTPAVLHLAAVDADFVGQLLDTAAAERNFAALALLGVVEETKADGALHVFAHHHRALGGDQVEVVTILLDYGLQSVICEAMLAKSLVLLFQFVNRLIDFH